MHDTINDSETENAFARFGYAARQFAYIREEFGEHSGTFIMTLHMLKLCRCHHFNLSQLQLQQKCEIVVRMSGE